MSTKLQLKVVTMGRYLPQVVESARLEERLGIPSGWSAKYSGVESRHHATEETNGYMGARAAESALEKAGMNLGDIDLIISAGGTFDYVLPNQASVTKRHMKDGDKYTTATFDIDSTCLSFVTALNVANNMLSDSVRNIMIISSEIASKGLDPANFETSTLFGDAAVACIVTASDEGGSRIVKSELKTYSEGVYYTLIEGGGNVRHFRDHPYDSTLHSLKMSGKRLLKLAKQKVPEYIDDFFSDLDVDFLDTDVIIPHQASKLGLALIKNEYDFKPGQFKETLSQYGNCIAASIPLTLHDCIERGELKRGDSCLLIGTSAGFSVGSVLLIF